MTLQDKIFTGRSEPEESWVHCVACGDDVPMTETHTEMVEGKIVYICNDHKKEANATSSNILRRKPQANA